MVDSRYTFIKRETLDYRQMVKISMYTLYFNSGALDVL